MIETLFFAYGLLHVKKFVYILNGYIEVEILQSIYLKTWSITNTILSAVQSWIDVSLKSGSGTRAKTMILHPN